LIFQYGLPLIKISFIEKPGRIQIMSNAIPNFDAFFKQVTNALPKGLLSLHQDLEKNLRVALDSALRKMNLVTREEFDIQMAVLEKTRLRLEALEVKVSTLEARQQQPTSEHSSDKPTE